MHPSGRWQELDPLLDRLLDGLHSVEDVARLNELLAADWDACRHYVAYLEVHNRLALCDAIREGDTREGDTIEFSTGERMLAARAGTAGGCEPPASRQLADLPPPVADFVPSATAFGLLLRPVAFAYTIAVVLLGAGLLASWAWNAPARPLRRPAELAEAPVKPPPVPGPAAGGTGSATGGTGSASGTPAAGGTGSASGPQTGAAGSASGTLAAGSGTFDGTILTNDERGSGQAVYRMGTRVSLVGPYRFYAPPDAHSAVLAYGRATVQVENGGKFTLQTPFTAVTCSGGEFGIELDRSGEGWIHSFGGAVGLSLHSFRAAVLWFQGGARKAPPDLVLGRNESVRIRQQEGGCLATVTDDAGLAAWLARRMSPPGPLPAAAPAPAPAPAPAEAVAVWGGRDSREPTAPGDSPARVAHAGAPRLSGAAPGPTGTSGGGVPASATVPVAWGLPTSSVGDGSTRRAVFSLAQFSPNVALADLVPGRSTLRVRFVARASIVHAVRLNGRDLPLPAQGLDGAVRQLGALVIHDGFVGGKGTNVLELDISSKDRRDMPPVEPISAARPPLELSVEVWTQLPPAAAPAADVRAKQAK